MHWKYGDEVKYVGYICAIFTVNNNVVFGGGKKKVVAVATVKSIITVSLSIICFQVRFIEVTGLTWEKQFLATLPIRVTGSTQNLDSY